MKKILVILLAAALVGCTLEEQVFDSQPSTYYQTVPQCKTGLNGCYIPLRSIYSNVDYFEACEIASDLIYCNTSSYYDAICDYSQSLPRFGATIWNQCYIGVMRCNAMYAALERAVAQQYIKEDEANPLFAECVILRAFYYYILTINFGDVPYYFEEVTDANNERISLMGRKPAKELRAELMDQLEYWLLEKQALPKRKTYDPENEYRIGMMVGCVIGGKLAMWNKRFDRAIDFFAPIEEVYGNKLASGDTSGGTSGGDEEDSSEDTSGEDENTSGSNISSYPRNALMDYDLKDVQFHNRYTPESIFELPGYTKDYGLRVTTGLAARCMPKRQSINVEGDEDDSDIIEDEDVDLTQQDDIFDSVMIPELGKTARTTGRYRPTPYFYQTLMPYNAKDKRRAVYDPAASTPQVAVEIEGGAGWLAWCYKGWRVDLSDELTGEPGAPFFKGVGSATGKPYLGDKFWCPGMVYSQDSNNLKIFRFAHVILDLAEANMRVGNWDLAFEYLNATKMRAGREDLSGGHTDEKKFMQELQEESARELFGEFTRRHNLVRWGIWYDQIINNLSGLKIHGFVLEGPCREYYPIPDQQIILSNYNLSNPEYDKYGL